MGHPNTFNEFDTIAALKKGKSIARFGDGEIKLIQGKDCVSQKHSREIANELEAVLTEYNPDCLIGIPNLTHKTAKDWFWDHYRKDEVTGLYAEKKQYYSAFITRPDSIPAIDTPEYWADVKSLWAGKDITLVRGDDRSLTPRQLKDAASIKEIFGPSQHAYEHIDRLEAEILEAGNKVVILCLGATATCLAWRLSVRGIQALDLGHIGMFMRRLGVSDFTKDDLITPYYAEQNAAMHRRQPWGESGKKYVHDVIAYANELHAENILDYGCGRGTLKQALTKHGFDLCPVIEYDPAIPGKEALPGQADLITCTDVLEHIEPELIHNVLEHLYRLTVKGCYLVIATRDCDAVLPDGRKAHLIIEGPEYWEGLIKKFKWNTARFETEFHKGGDQPKRLRVWLRK